MTLKFKRNLPLVLLLIGILVFMAATLGNQTIISYTVTPATVQAWTANLTASLMAVH